MTGTRGAAVPPTDALVLRVEDYQGETRWRWVLETAGGAFLADHQVRLDPAAPEYAGFVDPAAYLAHYAAPDRRRTDEPHWVDRLGAWLGKHVFGPIAQSILDYGTPVTVRVLIPPDPAPESALGDRGPASTQLYRPLELAHAGGRPLALQDVSLVFEVAGEAPPVRSVPMGDRLRLLAVFSVPSGGTALALRRERHALQQTVARIAQTRGRAVELRVLQYGATRERLREVLEDGEGWDVVHFSGHGLPQMLVLERDDGSHDLITADKLVELLRPARARLKLVTLAACLSAAPALAETLERLGLRHPPPAPSAAAALGPPAVRPPAAAAALGLPIVPTPSAQGTAGDPAATHGAAGENRDLEPAAGEPAAATNTRPEPAAGEPPATQGAASEGRNLEPAAGGSEVTTNSGQDSRRLPGVARALVSALDCAVLAMRFPVGDDFAVALDDALYGHLLGDGQPLPRALQRALGAALRGDANDATGAGVPPLSVATPALFGRRAAGLTLLAPTRSAGDFAVAPTGLAYFPPEPERFVGRVGPLARASAALAPDSRKTGVLFHGMAGAGKTACALELAYRYERDRFQAFAWYRAPDEGQAIEGALPALALETQLPGLEMVHVLERPEELAAFLPRLRRLLEQNSVLLVLDNLESLLTEAGGWRDARWGQVVTTLLGHRGLSRTVLTTRRLPVLPADVMARVQVQRMHALSLDEAVLLARELPHLGRLLRDDPDGNVSPIGAPSSASGGDSAAGASGSVSGKGSAAGAPEGAAAPRGRHGVSDGPALVARTLGVVQGHPKLLELADAQAADPAALAAHLDRAAAALEDGGAQVGAFFERGTTSLDAGEFLGALHGWTRRIVEGLSAEAQTFLAFLCALEEEDRTTSVVEANWAGVWRRIARPGDAPGLDTVLAPLIATALVESSPVETAPSGEGGSGDAPAATGVPDATYTYAIHPGVAEAVRAAADPAVDTATAQEVAAFWWAVVTAGREEEAGGRSGLVAEAARRGADYFVRLQQWNAASALLDQALARHPPPGTLVAVLPVVRRIAAVTRGTADEAGNTGLLARALRSAGLAAEAEPLLRAALTSAAAAGDFRLASGTAGELINLLLNTGRVGEAVELMTQKQEHTRRAGLGRWTQLSDEVQRLQLLNQLGRSAEVLPEVEHLRARMRALPEQSGQDESVTPWNVRELILYIGCRAAQTLQDWEAALSLNAEIVASTEARRAPPLEVARAWFNDYGPLLRLGRLDKARALLQACRAVFDRYGHVLSLGHVLSAQADVESRLGRPAEAVALSRTALRYKYLAGDPATCAISHFNLSNHLNATGAAPEVVLAHRAAAALLRYQIGADAELATTLRSLAGSFRSAAPGRPPVPASFDALCRVVEQVEGVRFRELFERLPQRATTGDECLREMLARVQDIAQAPVAPEPAPVPPPEPG